MLGLGLGLAPAADARASNCQSTLSDTSGSTTCRGGVGQYRVGVKCVNWAGNDSHVVYGPWLRTSSGQPSVAYCGWSWFWSEHATAVWAQTM